jgi:hypothetical protein
VAARGLARILAAVVSGLGVWVVSDGPLNACGSVVAARPMPGRA